MSTKDCFQDLTVHQNTIFVDCFNSIILRKVKKNLVFKQWAQELETKYQIRWQKFYRSYRRTNFWLCFKKIFKNFILQERFDIVLKEMFENLFKGNTETVNDFITTAKSVYLEKEKNIQTVNQSLINFLRKQQQNGKSIYVVSDFYCSADDIKIWLSNLKIDNVFTQVFSSSDFGKEKSTAGLYKALLKQLKLSAHDVIMFGDNFWSDNLMAKSCGLAAKMIKNQKEYIK